jgi:hypothetical protein
VDLYEPGSGSQVHDFNGGIQPSGLFWIVQLPDSAIQVSRDGSRAKMDARNVSVLDSFQFGGPNSVPATLSFTIQWKATAAPHRRGQGRRVPPTDPAAFLGDFATARSTASFSGSELGFSFRSTTATSDRGYAEMGFERNGTFL